jgi:hypothetical protein
VFGFGEKRRAEKEAQAEALAAAEIRSTVAGLIHFVDGATGDAADWPLVPKPGERLACAIEGGGLFEPRREPGH